MVKNDPSLKRYMRQIRRELPCRLQEKKVILSHLEEGIIDYIEDNPTSDITAVQDCFGTPKEIAASYLYEQAPLVMLQKIRIKKKVLQMVAGMMAAIVLIWVSAVAVEMIDSRKSSHGYIVVTIEKT